MSNPDIVLTRRQMIAGAAGLAAMSAFPLAAQKRSMFARTRAVIESHFAAGDVPGVIAAIVTRGSVPFFVASGSLAFGSTAPMDADSLFRVYSMTKLVTGAAAGILIEDGKLSLDQPVTDYVPEFRRILVAKDASAGLDGGPPANRMTIRHLLTHSSGLTYHYSGETAVHLDYRRKGIFPTTGAIIDPRPAIDGAKPRDLDDLVGRLAEIPLLFEPGTAYEYGVSMDVMGLVIQRAAGIGFDRFVQQRLLDPLRMTDTVWQLRTGQLPRLASLYAWSGGNRYLIDGPGHTAFAEPVTLFTGGAGLISSPRDFLAFLAMLLNDGRGERGRIMHARTARLIRSDILPAGVRFGDSEGHGFGGYVRRRDDPASGGQRAGCYGHHGAAGTIAWIDPAQGLAATIMVQQFPYDRTPILQEIRAAIAADLA